MANSEDPIVNEQQWTALAEAAWACRENAYILGDTKVGAAVLGADGQVYTGCNIEHQYRSHDVHAEVNAISTMVAAGCTKLIAVVVVAERILFTPCGACMDWIFQFGGSSCFVAFQPSRGSAMKIYQARDLMPYYPE